MKYKNKIIIIVSILWIIYFITLFVSLSNRNSKIQESIWNIGIALHSFYMNETISITSKYSHKEQYSDEEMAQILFDSVINKQETTYNNVKVSDTRRWALGMNLGWNTYQYEEALLQCYKGLKQLYIHPNYEAYAIQILECMSAIDSWINASKAVVINPDAVITKGNYLMDTFYNNIDNTICDLSNPKCVFRNFLQWFRSLLKKQASFFETLNHKSRYNK